MGELSHNCVDKNNGYLSKSEREGLARSGFEALGIVENKVANT